MIQVTPDEAFVLGLALDDWLTQNTPGDDDSSQDRWDRTSELARRMNEASAGVDPETVFRKPNPAACPQCGSLDNVQAQGWVFARYSLDVDDAGQLDYPTGAKMEWDMCKPFQEVPADLDPSAEYLSCTSCDVDYWYLPPPLDRTTTTGRILRVITKQGAAA